MGRKRRSGGRSAAKRKADKKKALKKQQQQQQKKQQQKKQAPKKTTNFGNRIKKNVNRIKVSISNAVNNTINKTKDKVKKTISNVKKSFTNTSNKVNQSISKIKKAAENRNKLTVQGAHNTTQTFTKKQQDLAKKVNINLTKKDQWGRTQYTFNKDGNLTERSNVFTRHPQTGQMLGVMSKNERRKFESQFTVKGYASSGRSVPQTRAQELRSKLTSQVGNFVGESVFGLAHSALMSPLAKEAADFYTNKRPDYIPTSMQVEDGDIGYGKPANDGSLRSRIGGMLGDAIDRSSNPAIRNQLNQYSGLQRIGGEIQNKKWRDRLQSGNLSGALNTYRGTHSLVSRYGGQYPTASGIARRFADRAGNFLNNKGFVTSDQPTNVTNQAVNQRTRLARQQSTGRRGSRSGGFIDEAPSFLDAATRYDQSTITEQGTTALEKYLSSQSSTQKAYKDELSNIQSDKSFFENELARIKTDRSTLDTSLQDIETGRKEYTDLFASLDPQKASYEAQYNEAVRYRDEFKRDLRSISDEYKAAGYSPTEINKELEGLLAYRKTYDDYFNTANTNRSEFNKYYSGIQSDRSALDAYYKQTQSQSSALNQYRDQTTAQQSSLLNYFDQFSKQKQQYEQGVRYNTLQLQQQIDNQSRGQVSGVRSANYLTPFDQRYKSPRQQFGRRSRRRSRAKNYNLTIGSIAGSDIPSSINI